MSIDQVQHLLAQTLVHFLWQGLVIGVVSAVLMRCFADRANARYGVGIVGLLAMATAPLFTFGALMPAAISTGAAPPIVATGDFSGPATTTPAPVFDKEPVVATGHVEIAAGGATYES